MQLFTVQAEESFAAVVPLYNRRDLIDETLLSLKQQGRAFDEIIVVDDGSTDDSAELVRRDHSDVSLIQTPNEGVQSARNRGVQEARSNWIVFCDSDDLLEENYLSLVEEALKTDRTIDALYVNFRTFGPRSVSQTSKFSEAPNEYWPQPDCLGAKIRSCPELEQLIRFQPFFQTGLVVRREVFFECGQYDRRLKGWRSEDLEFTLRLIQRFRVKALDAVVARVRKHGGNDSAVFHHVLNGEADVLEFFANEHLCEPLKRRFIRAACMRRWEALDHCVGQRDWPTAAGCVARLNLPAPSLKLLSKYLLVRLGAAHFFDRLHFK
jgi:glycosyltransferase involved in cell wall biosynthesis